MDETTANIRTNAMHGALQNTAINLVTPFLGIDLIRLGGSNFEVGLLSGIPPLAQAATAIAGARWIETVRNPHRAIAATFLLARFCFLLLALVNVGEGRWRAPALIAVLALMSLPTAVANVNWQGFIAGIIPPRRRAHAFALRSRAASLAGILAVVVGGWAIRADAGERGYIWVFGVAFLVGLAEVLVFLRLRGEPPPPRPARAVGPPTRRLLAMPQFRTYTVSSLIFYVGWVMTWPLALRYQVSVDHATNLWMGLFTAVNGVCMALASGFWGRVATRHGVRRVLPLAALGLVGVPVMYALSPSLPVILLIAVVGGTMGSGVNMLLLVRLLEVTGGEDQMIGVGFANTVNGVAGVLGPLVGVWLVGSMGLTNVFWVSAALRLLGGVAFGALGSGWMRTRRMALAGGAEEG